jgi:hypothetical protein
VEDLFADGHIQVRSRPAPGLCVGGNIHTFQTSVSVQWMRQPACSPHVSILPDSSESPGLSGMALC